MRRQRDMASKPMVIMSRRHKKQRKQTIEFDQADTEKRIPPGGEAITQLGDEATAGTTAEELANAGGRNETDNAEESPAAEAETRSRRAFFGRSGHLAVMSEFLYRRINVAIPEVDVGDDVFVVKGSDDTVTRVQVKSAEAKPQANSYFALFNVPLAQLSVPRDTPALVYIFAVRFKNRWSDFVVIRRSTLFARFNEGAGYRRVPPDGKEYVQFRVVFTEAAAQCGMVNLQLYRNIWDPWPPQQLEEEETPPRVPGNTGEAGPTGDTLPDENADVRS